MTFADLLPYFGMAAWAFLAATLLPFSSEVGLWTGVAKGHLDPVGLFTAATVGNVAGSCLNWWLGSQLAKFGDAPWSPIKPSALAAAHRRFMRWGVWSLLFSWVPIVGDPLTFVAGFLGVSMKIFLPLVAVGKAARYIVVVASAT